MKKLLLLVCVIVSLFSACTPSDELGYEVTDERDHTYEIRYNSTFKESELSLINKTTNETILITDKQGLYRFDLKYGNTYTFKITQTNPVDRKYTEIILKDITVDEVKDDFRSDKCVLGWSYTLTIH